MLLSFLVLGLTSIVSSAKIALSWGQGLSSLTNGTESQKRLIEYCQKTPLDIVLLSYAFDAPGTPINLSNLCSSFLLHTSDQTCSQIGQDISGCQALGKKVLLTLTTTEGPKNEDTPADYAQLLVNMFGARSPDLIVDRPFGEAVVDGFNLAPITGSGCYYTNLAKHLQAVDSSMLLAASPSCETKHVLNSAMYHVTFDYWFVQFYPERCKLDNNSWNRWLDTADNAPEDVKIFVALLGGDIGPFSGYMDMDVIRDKLPIFKGHPAFGGFAISDASLTNIDDPLSKKLLELLK